MKFYGGQSSNANKTESDKKYSSIFHDLKFSYYVYKNFCQSNPHIFNKFQEKKIYNIFNIRLQRMFNIFFWILNNLFISIAILK